jgi:hypothetical protein
MAMDGMGKSSDGARQILAQKGREGGYRRRRIGEVDHERYPSVHTMVNRKWRRAWRFHR